MSNYSKTTDFAAKDSLPSGDAAKIIRGSEFETEFDNISTAIATKADSASPTFTGTVTIDGLTVNGNTTLGNAATDTVTVTADIASNLIPSADNTHDLGASGAEWKDLYVDGTAYVDTLDLNGTAVTSTAAELNLLDGATVTTAEINILDGVTATTAEINLLDGVTATTAELNYVDGVTSAIQTQIDTKAPTASPTFTGTVTADVLTVSGDANFDSGTLFVDVSADKVGVGTTSPSATLHAYHATDDTVLKVESGDGQSRIDLIDSGGTARLNSIGSDLRLEADPSNSVANSAIDFKVDGTQVMRINDSFNVGIGTTSPSAKLDVAGTIEFDGLSGTGSVTITDILDEDNMASNSATALATQQSIKAYVDSQVATADTLAEVLGNGNTTGGTDIAVGTGDDITFADSSKAIFGAGSDLQIYHDGSNSYISDNGTGNLVLRGGNFVVDAATSGNARLITANATSKEVKLYNNDAQKLATTSTGIDVTGTVTADGLTVEADTILLDSASSAFMKIDRGNNTSFGITRYYTAGTEDWRLGTLNDGTSDFYLQDSGSAERFKVGTNGDVSLYEDTGTTAKFFWDASAESLGIGTSSPDTAIHITDASPKITLTDTGSSNNDTKLTSTGGSFLVEVDDNNEAADSSFRVQIDNSERVRIDSSGNLLVGKTGTGIAEDGIALVPDGDSAITRSDGSVLYLNRNDSDGIILNLRKDNTTVGAIGTLGGEIYIQSDDVGLQFDASGNDIVPYGGGFQDGVIDLGSSGNRFKDLYLSGGAYLGGTAAANKLDDYEEGTFTPAFSGGDYTFTYNKQKGSYTKIGNRVFVDMHLYIDSSTAPSGSTDGDLNVTGLPFAFNAQNSVDILAVSIGFKQQIVNTEDSLSVKFVSGNSSFTIHKDLSTGFPDGSLLQASDLVANSRLRIQFSYPTNS